MFLIFSLSLLHQKKGEMVNFENRSVLCYRYSCIDQLSNVLKSRLSRKKMFFLKRTLYGTGMFLPCKCLLKVPLRGYFLMLLALLFQDVCSLVITTAIFLYKVLPTSNVIEPFDTDCDWDCMLVVIWRFAFSFLFFNLMQSRKL